MTTEQIVAISAPMAFNGVVITVLGLYLKVRFDAINQRFDDMRELWRAELHRVEGFLDARLKCGGRAKAVSNFANAPPEYRGPVIRYFTGVNRYSQV